MYCACTVQSCSGSRLRLLCHDRNCGNQNKLVDKHMNCCITSTVKHVTWNIGTSQHFTNDNTAFSWFCDVAHKLSVRSELNLNLIQITALCCGWGKQWSVYHKPVSVPQETNTTGFLRCWFKGKLYLIKLLKLPFKSLLDTRSVSRDSINFVSSVHKQASIIL